MRILGGHDYYDTALAFGRDETLVFVRATAEKAERIRPSAAPLIVPKSKTLSFKPDSYLSQNEVSHNGVDYTAFPHILWFAGQRYGAMRIARRGYRIGEYSMDDLWFWDADRFGEFLASIDVQLCDPKKGRSPEDSINSSNIADFFTDPGSASEREWLVERGISIALLEIDRYTYAENYSWRIDSDGLKDVHFQRRLNPYEAFQALSQWIGGVLPRPGAPIVTIRDEKTMLSKHGMDKWSFRKPPEND